MNGTHAARTQTHHTQISDIPEFTGRLHSCVMPHRRTGGDGGQKTPGQTWHYGLPMSARELYVAYAGSYLPA